MQKKPSFERRTSKTYSYDGFFCEKLYLRYCQGSEYVSASFYENVDIIFAFYYVVIRVKFPAFQKDNIMDPSDGLITKLGIKAF